MVRKIVYIIVLLLLAISVEAQVIKNRPDSFGSLTEQQFITLTIEQFSALNP